MMNEQEAKRLALVAAGVPLSAVHTRDNPWRDKDGAWRVEWDAFDYGASDYTDVEHVESIAMVFGVPVECVEFDGGGCFDEQCQCGIRTVHRVVAP